MLWRDNEAEDGACILLSLHVFSVSGWKNSFVSVLHQAALGALGPEALAGQPVCPSGSSDVCGTA